MITRLLATFSAFLVLMFGAVAMPTVAHAAVPGNYYSCSLTDKGYGTIKAGRTYADLAMTNTNTMNSQSKKAYLSLYSSSGNYLWGKGTAYNIPSYPKRYYFSSVNSGQYIVAKFHWDIKYQTDRYCTAYYKVA